MIDWGSVDRETLEQRLKCATSRLRQAGYDAVWTLREPATRQLLSEALAELGTPFSESHARVLQMSDGAGCTFLAGPGEFPNLDIYGVQDLLRATASTRRLDNYAKPELPPSRIVHFASAGSGIFYIMDPDRPALASHEYAIVPVDYDEPYLWRTDFVPMCESFGAWFNGVLNAFETDGAFLRKYNLTDFLAG
jgi:hypothetical protein